MSFLQKPKDLALKLWSRPNARAAIIITLLTFLSRGLGLVRQVFIYQRMDKEASDLLLAANKIPENIAQLLIMGTIITSVLPIATRIDTKAEGDETQVSKYLNLMLLSFLILIFSLNLVVLIFTPEILQLPFVTSSNLLDSFRDSGRLDDYFLTTRILLLAPLLFCAQAILSVFLFLKKRFTTYALAGTIYNTGAIIGILITAKNGYITTAWGMMVGALVTTLVYVWEAKKFGFRGLGIIFNTAESFASIYRKFKADFIRTWQLFLPRIFILDSVVTANLLITPIAQNIGQVTAVDIALSIQGAFFVIVTSLSTVLFPDMAKLFNKDNMDKTAWKSIWYYSKNVIYLGIGVTVVTWFGASLIMNIFEILGKGQNNAPYIVAISQIAALSLVMRALREILSKYFFVRERQWEPTILSVLAIFSQILLTLGLRSFGVDSGYNVAISLVLSNFVWLLVAVSLIYRDWLKQYDEIYTSVKISKNVSKV